MHHLRKYHRAEGTMYTQSDVHDMAPDETGGGVDDSPSLSASQVSLETISANVLKMSKGEDILKQYLINEKSAKQKENETAQLFATILEQQNFDYALAVRGLISICSARRTNVPYEFIKTVTEESTALFLNLGILCFGLQKDELDNLAKITRHLAPLHNQYLSIPTSPDEIDSYLLAPSNRYSLRNLIPVPHVDQIGDKSHSYTDFVKMVPYIAIFPTCQDFALPDRYQSLTECPKYVSLKEKIYPDEVIANVENRKNVIVIILLWADGFDQNRSKTNRGSAWALTATYFFIESQAGGSTVEDRVYQMRTVLIAMGPDKKSFKHSRVFRRMVEDFGPYQNNSQSQHPNAIVGRSRYHGAEKEISFYPILLGALFDNPERRSNFALRMGNSSNHVMFGISCHYQRLLLPFQACTRCLTTIRDYSGAKSWSTRCRPRCEECLSFSVESLLGGGQYANPIFTPPVKEGIDDDEIPGKHLFTHPGRLSSSLLKKAWKYAFDRFTDNHYRPEHITSYLGEVMCLNSAEVDRFLSEARSVLHIRDIQAGEYNNEAEPLDEHIARLVSALHENPDYEETLCCYPPLWDLLELDQGFETIMHNGMNTGKALADFLFRWAANNREASQTINKAKPHFTAVQLLRLENFKALPFDKSTFGGYVGENWSCFHQISPWAFSFLDDPDMQTTIFHPPTEKAVTDYSVKELKAWLLCRGLHFPTVARKTELLSLVLHFQVDGDHHHAADSVTTGSGPQGTQMRQIFLASSRYFSSLMADTTPTTMSAAMEREHRSESYAMLLLAEITSFLDIQPEVDDAGKEVRKKSSLLGLLRTPSHFEHVPQVRSLHEGGVLGEGM
eukprot:scaffold11033_cov134-Cylindrotheca_fusiformis.AAC.3